MDWYTVNHRDFTETKNLFTSDYSQKGINILQYSTKNSQKLVFQLKLEFLYIFTHTHSQNKTQQNGASCHAFLHHFHILTRQWLATTITVIVVYKRRNIYKLDLCLGNALNKYDAVEGFLYVLLILPYFDICTYQKQILTNNPVNI